LIPKTFEATKIEAFIKELSEEELRYLNRLIVERLKLIDQAKSTRAMGRFNIGESVEFPDREGRIKSGRIVRLNKKTVTIITDDGEQWNVSPGLLKEKGK
jgi:hypothetical protein